jgi:hypothetical protein
MPLPSFDSRSNHLPRRVQFAFDMLQFTNKSFLRFFSIVQIYLYSRFSILGSSKNGIISSRKIKTWLFLQLEKICFENSSFFRFVCSKPVNQKSFNPFPLSFLSFFSVRSHSTEDLLRHDTLLLASACQQIVWICYLHIPLKSEMNRGKISGPLRWELIMANGRLAEWYLIIICGSKLGNSEYSRKIVIVDTFSGRCLCFYVAYFQEHQRKMSFSLLTKWLIGNSAHIVGISRDLPSFHPSLYYIPTFDWHWFVVYCRDMIQFPIRPNITNSARVYQKLKEEEKANRNLIRSWK